MEQRTLGKTSIRVAPWAFGGNVFGWTVNEPTSFRLLDAFVAAGCNLIDTADSYSRWVPGNRGGESEIIIGNWMKRKGNRSQVVIATKLGSDLGNGKKGLSRQYMMQAVEASLKRLQTDYIDLYQSHFDDPETPVEETMDAFADLVKQGKIRAAGASNLSAQRLQRSLDYCKTTGLPGYETLQPEYNLYERKQYEEEYETIVLKEGLSVLNYFALASGFLTGKYRSAADAGKSARGAEIVQKYVNPRGMRIIRSLDAVSARYECSAGTIALAWLLARPGIAAPIASATTEWQIQELVAATNLRLDAESILELNKASSYDAP